MEYAGPVLQVTLLNICLSFFSFNRGVVSVICHTYSTLEIKLGEAQIQTVTEPQVIIFIFLFLLGLVQQCLCKSQIPR